MNFRDFSSSISNKPLPKDDDTEGLYRVGFALHENEVYPVSSYTPEEKAVCFYTKDEYQRIRTEDMIPTVRKMAQPLVSLSKTECSRGLEVFTPQVAALRKAWIIMNRESVKNRQSGSMTSCCLQQSAKAARHRGMKDEEAADEVHFARASPVAPFPRQQNTALPPMSPRKLAKCSTIPSILMSPLSSKGFLLAKPKDYQPSPKKAALKACMHMKSGIVCI